MSIVLCLLIRKVILRKGQCKIKKKLEIKVE